MGEEAMLKLFTVYRGQLLTLPMRMYAGEKVAKSVKKQFNGHNTAELMHKYDYSQRWISKAIGQRNN
ncbi:Mor transcription activator family protein [Latilactobacillus graminis]|nr:Mor transcription activator family protein [Latilactobacillus graminis]